MLTTKCLATVTSVGLITLGAAAGQTQQQQPQAPSMTFFVTSTGLGKGADLGGLDGADRQCQALAQAAGAGGKTWRAYLSTQAVDGVAAVNGKAELKRADVTYEELAELLREHGLEETKGSIAAKISRGAFPACNVLYRRNEGDWTGASKLRGYLNEA